MLVRNALQCLKGSAVWTTSASVAVRSLTPPAQQHYPLPSLQQYQQPLVASEVTRGLTSTASWVPSPVTGWLKRRQRRLLKQQGIKPAARLIAGAVSPHRPVPAHIHRPDYAAAVATTGSRSSSTGPGLSKRPEIQADASSQAGMRAAGKLAAEALQLAGSMAVPGVTTDAIDAAVHEFIISRGAYPSPLGYHGFPKSICTSVNEVVCHGIPDSRPLQEGDIVNVDVTSFLGGFHGDTNATFLVGQVTDAAAELVQTTHACLEAAIAVCGPGVPFRHIGHTIHRLADAAGMTVIWGFVGHGIGRTFHAAPGVLHHRNLRLDVMRQWQTFTIEPILALGTTQHCSWPADASGWTVVTADGSLAAQFEHTLMITDTGVEVLTRSDAGKSV